MCEGLKPDSETGAQDLALFGLFRQAVRSTRCNIYLRLHSLSAKMLIVAQFLFLPTSGTFAKMSRIRASRFI